jgi:hypothetical protein
MLPIQTIVYTLNLDSCKLRIILARRERYLHAVYRGDYCAYTKALKAAFIVMSCVLVDLFFKINIVINYNKISKLIIFRYVTEICVQKMYYFFGHILCFGQDWEYQPGLAPVTVACHKCSHTLQLSVSYRTKDIFLELIRLVLMVQIQSQILTVSVSLPLK